MGPALSAAPGTGYLAQLAALGTLGKHQRERAARCAGLPAPARPKGQSVIY